MADFRTNYACSETGSLPMKSTKRWMLHNRPTYNTRISQGTNGVNGPRNIAAYLAKCICSVFDSQVRISACACNFVNASCLDKLVRFLSRRRWLRGKTLSALYNANIMKASCWRIRTSLLCNLSITERIGACGEYRFTNEHGASRHLISNPSTRRRIRP